MTGPSILLIALGFLGAYYEALDLHLVGWILTGIAAVTALVAANHAFHEGDWYNMFAYPVRVGIGIFIGALLGGFVKFASGPFVVWSSSGSKNMFVFIFGIVSWAIAEFYIHDSVEHMICGFLGMIGVSSPTCE